MYERILGCCGYDFEHSERRLGVSIGKSPGYLVVIHDPSLSFDLVPLDPQALTREMAKLLKPQTELYHYSMLS